MDVKSGERFAQRQKTKKQTKRNNKMINNNKSFLRYKFSLPIFSFVNVEYVLVGSSVASFEDGFILRSNWKRIVRR